MASADSSGAGTARKLNIDREVALMRQMSVDQLRTKFAEVHGEATRSRHKDWLIKRIAWRLQANAEGGLSERALRRAAELANDGDFRVTAPRAAGASESPVPSLSERPDDRLPMVGTVLTRKYKGRVIQVTVLEEGFQYEGERYASLSAVAKAITGTHWNGFHFFGLSKTETRV